MSSRLPGTPPAGATQVIRSMGIIHPSAISRGNFGWESPTRKALRRLATDMHAPGPTPPDPQVVGTPPGALLFPTPTQIEEYLTDPLMEQGVVVDIENPGNVLKIVGWCRLADLKSLVVWFVMWDGSPAWEDHRERALVFNLVKRAWGNTRIPIWTHNGQAHDLPYMEKYGFGPIGNFGGDTMLMLRHAFPEQPAGLLWAACNLVGGFPYKHWIKWDEQDDTEQINK